MAQADGGRSTPAIYDQSRNRRESLIAIGLGAATAVAATAVTLRISGAAGIDPIFAMIDAHKVAADAFASHIKKYDLFDLDAETAKAAESQWAVLCAAETQAVEALLDTDNRPTSIDGILALARYIVSLEAHGHGLPDGYLTQARPGALCGVDYSTAMLECIADALEALGTS